MSLQKIYCISLLLGLLCLCRECVGWVGLTRHIVPSPAVCYAMGGNPSPHPSGAGAGWLCDVPDAPSPPPPSAPSPSPPAASVCSAGQYRRAGSCAPYPVGTHKSASGDQACTVCPNGETHSLQGPTSVNSCIDMGPDDCDSCGIGKYNAAIGEETCTLCPAGTYVDETGQTECEDCPVGNSMCKILAIIV